jgi:K+-sensing histidine kinase KdpD
MSILIMAPFALRAQTATQVVTFSVVSSSRVAIGNLAAPVQMAAPSSDRASRTSAMVAGTSYLVTTNEKNQKISASLDASVPNALSLSVALGAPHGAMSNGPRTLGTTATDVVTGITGSDGAPLPMRYQWNGSSSGSAAALKHRVVTYTITAGL